MVFGYRMGFECNFEGEYNESRPIICFPTSLPLSLPLLMYVHSFARTFVEHKEGFILFIKQSCDLLFLAA